MTAVESQAMAQSQAILRQAVDRFRTLLPEVRALLEAHLPESWPTAAQVLGRFIEKPLPPLALLPLASAEAAGGDPRQAIPAAASWLVLNLGMRLLDDAQDRDRPEGTWAELGVERTSNLAGALAVLAFQLLDRTEGPEERRGRLRAIYHEELLRIAAGQDRDLMGPAESLEACWKIIEEKNGRIFALGCACGAQAGGAPPGQVEALRRYGLHLGVTLQIFDDIEGIWEDPTDLRSGRITLPLLYGLHSEHPLRQELAELVRGGQVPRQEARVREILDAMETREFLLFAACKEHEQALSALVRCPGQDGSAVLRAYITGLFSRLDEVLEQRP